MTHNVYRVRARGMPGPGLSEDQEADLALVTGATRTVATFADRDAIPGDKRPYGLHIYVTEGERMFVWEADGISPGVDGWVGQRTDAELQTVLDGAFSGIDDALDAANASIVGNEVASIARDNALSSAISDVSNQAAAIYPVEITSISATPASGELGATTSSLALAWSILIEDGAPLTQKVTWAGNTVYLDGAARSLALPQNWAAQTNALVIGDSLSSPGYSDDLATDNGLTVTRVALGAQSSYKQALRVGAWPITLTLSGNTLPATGTAGTVTLINGAAPDLANPASILTTAAGDVGAGHHISGTINGVAVTMSHYPATEPNLYKITQAGGAPVAIPAGSLFVPAWAADMASKELWICVGRNNIADPARIKADVNAMIRMGRGQRILLFGIINAPDEGTGTADLATIKALNDWMRATYPGLYAVDGSGRDLRQALLASGASTGNDLTDRNNEVIPRSLRLAPNDLHLNSTGYSIWVALAQAFRDAQLAPATGIADGMVITLNANGRLRQLIWSKLPRRFWGVSANTALTSAQIIALAGSELSSSRAKAFTASAADQYVHIAYLASQGDPTSYKIGGFAETTVKTTVSVTTAAGYTANYTVLRSLNKLTGSVSVEVQ